MAREPVVDTKVADELSALLRMALGLEPSLPFAIVEEDWPRIVAMARMQTVEALLDSAIRLLPESSLPSQDILVEVMLEADRVSRRSSSVADAAKTLLDSLQSQGLHPLVMKGPSVARYYPVPELRAAGDLDLFISQEEAPRLLDYLREQGARPEKTPDGSYFCQGGPVDIDIHFSYFDLYAPEGKLPPVGTPEAELLMLSAHILKHAVGPGVGLRQMCDMAMAYKALLAAANKDLLLAGYRDTGTLHWNQVLDAFLKQHFHLETGLFPDKEASGRLRRDVRQLERIVFTGGNFGHFSGHREKALKAPAPLRKLHTAWRFLKRVPFSVRCARRNYFQYVSSLIRGNLS